MSDVQIIWSYFWFESKFCDVHSVHNSHRNRVANTYAPYRCRRNIEKVIRNKHILCRSDFYLFYTKSIIYLFISSRSHCDTVSGKETCDFGTPFVDFGWFFIAHTSYRFDVKQKSVGIMASAMGRCECRRAHQFITTACVSVCVCVRG